MRNIESSHRFAHERTLLSVPETMSRRRYQLVSIPKSCVSFFSLFLSHTRSARIGSRFAASSAREATTVKHFRSSSMITGCGEIEKPRVLRHA